MTNPFRVVHNETEPTRPLENNQVARVLVAMTQLERATRLVQRARYELADALKEAQRS
jgi:hypothetical protein